MNRVKKKSIGDKLGVIYAVLLFAFERGSAFAIPAALCADLCGFVAASWAVRLFFGG